MMKRALFVMILFGGCDLADSDRAGEVGDLCYAGNLSSNEDVATCREGLDCPTGNPDVAQYCTASARQLCYAGNLFITSDAKPCVVGFYCPTGNPDVAQWCQPSK